MFKKKQVVNSFSNQMLRDRTSVIKKKYVIQRHGIFLISKDIKILYLVSKLQFCWIYRLYFELVSWNIYPRKNKRNNFTEFFLHYCKKKIIIIIIITFCKMITLGGVSPLMTHTPHGYSALLQNSPI